MLGAVAAAFLEMPEATFWWSHLKGGSAAWQTENGYRRIPEIVPAPEEAAWLITGLTDDDKAVFEWLTRIAAVTYRPMSGI